MNTIIYKLQLDYLFIWYIHKKMCIRWGNAYSQSFSVSNVAKQDGVLSPYLFNVYMDDLNVSLNSSNVVGQIENIFSSFY